MVVGVFPALKLGVLFIKQISKPLTKVLINQAKNHPVFRTYIIIPPAQFYHWAEVKAKMYLMNLGKPTKVRKLNDEMAIELGANLMGEVIIFSVAGGCLLFEYSRQQAKEAKKEQIRAEQLEKFTSDIQGLYEIVMKQKSEINHLNLIIEELSKKAKWKLPLKNTIVDKNNQNYTKMNITDINKDNYKESNESNVDRQDNKSIVVHAIECYEKDIKGEKPS